MRLVHSRLVDGHTKVEADVILSLQTRVGFHLIMVEDKVVSTFVKFMKN